MLADPQVEAVIIAIADEFHVPAALKAIAAGKHVLVEKPLGTTVESCRELRDRAAAAKLVVQVGNNRRFDPGIAFARNFIVGEMGQRMALKSWYYDSVYRYTMTDNLQPIPITSDQARRPEGDPKADRRRYYLLTHGSHLVDTARFLGGPIVGLRARLLERFRRILLVHRRWTSPTARSVISILQIPVRGDFQEGFSGTRRARQRDGPRSSAVVSQVERYRVFSARAIASFIGSWGKTPIHTSCRSRASRPRSSRVCHKMARTSTTAWRPCRRWWRLRGRLRRKNMSGSAM